MGLSQKIEFKYPSKNKLADFIEILCSNYSLLKEGNLLKISSRGSDHFTFEMAIEDYGLYTHRSGQYFEFLGILIEELSGKFGKLDHLGL